jgi:enolase
MVNIKSIRAVEILDSRGNPTLEVKIELEGGCIGVAAVLSITYTESQYRLVWPEDAIERGIDVNIINHSDIRKIEYDNKHHTTYQTRCMAGT